MRGVGVILAVLLASLGLAHDPNLSSIRIIHRADDVLISAGTHRSQLADKSASDDDLKAAFSRQVKLRVDGQEFTAENPILIEDPSTDQISWQATIPGSPKSIEALQRFYPKNPEARTLVTVVKNGLVVEDILLDRDHPDWTQNEPPLGFWATVVRYIFLGFEHILIGADHVLFVLGLVLLGGSFRSLVKTITAFTLAHSITLTLAVLGWVNLSPRIVEPLIALSIIAIAIENLRPGGDDRELKADYRPWVAFGFGLLHGFGFAGVLSEIGLPGSAMSAALVSFNIGVEVGQLLIVMLASPLIAIAIKKAPMFWPKAAMAGSILIGLFGAWWVVERVFFG